MGRTWFYRQLLSYLPVLFIVITFLFFVFFQLLSEQNRREALEANKMLSLQAMRLVDTSLKAIDHMVMMESINNKGLGEFFDSSKQDGVYIDINAVKQMQNMMTAQTLIESIYLVRFDDGHVLSNATSSTLEDYKDRSFVETYMGKSSSKQWTGVRMFTQFTVKGDKQVVSLVRGMPFITGGKGLIVVNIETKSLSSLIGNLYDPEVSFISMQDNAGQSMLSNEAVSSHAKTYSRYISSYTGWTYESGLVQGQFVQLISSLYNVWFIIGIIMIVLAFGWIVFITRRNARPIEQIVERLQAFIQPVGNGHGNREKRGKVEEFSILESAFDHMILQFKQYQQRHRETLQLRTKDLFQQLVEGGSPFTEKEWKKEAEGMGLPALYGWHRLIVVEMDRYAEFSGAFNRRDQSLMKFALRHIIGELAAKHQVTLWCEWMTASQLGVLAFGDQADAGEEEDRTEELLELVRQWTQHHLKFTITAGFGERSIQLKDITRSYREALGALNYKIALGENRLITMKDLTNQGQAEVYAQLNAIRAIAQAYRMQEDWESRYEELFVQLRQGLLTKDEIGNLINYFIYYLGKELSSLGKDAMELWQKEGLPKLSVSLETYLSLEQLREETQLGLTAIAGQLAELQGVRQHAATIKDMRKYMESHYANANLSLDYLSEQFHLNPKYLSKLFKEETGRKFVDYLIDIRMEQAKRLLLESGLSVQEVAEGVGYTSAISFSRVFRKIYGLSPSEFREREARLQSG